MFRSRCWTLLGAAALIALLVGPVVPWTPTRPVSADAGSYVGWRGFSAPCPSYIGGAGIAFDGVNLWYSCTATGDTPDLYRADARSGAVIQSYQIAHGLGALAWDSNRQQIWAGWGLNADGTGADGKVRLIDPANPGANVVQFQATEALLSGLNTGLAYDAKTDTVYLSDENSDRIFWYGADGSLRGAFPSAPAWLQPGCLTSGLGIAGDYLFETSSNCHRVWVVARNVENPSGERPYAFDFPLNAADPSAGESYSLDLECDSVTFAPKTVIWVMQKSEPRRAIAYEAASLSSAGRGSGLSISCGTGDGGDTDGDGLPDAWERDGFRSDPNGRGQEVTVPLPDLGADLNQKDVYLQIDWQDNQRLDPQAIEQVVSAFRGHGIRLHVDHGPQSTDYVTGRVWGASLSRARAIPASYNLRQTDANGFYDWTEFQRVKDAEGFVASGRQPVFHYAISATDCGSVRTDYPPTPPSPISGVSRHTDATGSSDFLICLGHFFNGTEEDAPSNRVPGQAGTLMHELGHNLGLLHGGADDVGYKPNYLSVMNYSFQLGGLIAADGAQSTRRVLNYSEQVFASLREPRLSEPAGLGAAAASFGTRHFCDGRFEPVPAQAGWHLADVDVDWNCRDGIESREIAFNVNGNENPNEELRGFDDWPHLKFKVGAIGSRGAPRLPMRTSAERLTVEIARRIVSVRPYSPPSVGRAADPGLTAWLARALPGAR